MLQAKGVAASYQPDYFMDIESARVIVRTGKETTDYGTTGYVVCLL